MKVYFRTVMVKSRKPFLWIKELTHLKQGLFFFSGGPATTIFTCVCEQKYQEDKGRARHMGWVQEDRVWKGGQQGALSCLIYAREPFTPSWLQGWGYQRTVSKRRAQRWTLLKRTVCWVSLPIVYTNHFSSWKMSRNLGFWFSSLCPLPNSLGKTSSSCKHSWKPNFIHRLSEILKAYSGEREHITL